MADERDELSPSQQLLGVALDLNEAVYELISLAQTPDILGRLVEAQANGEPLAVPLFSEAFDKIASSVCDLFHAAGRPAPLEPLANAAECWLRGET